MHSSIWNTPNRIPSTCRSILFTTKLTRVLEMRYGIRGIRISLNCISRRSFQARAKHRNTHTSRLTAGAVSMSKNWDKTNISRTPAPNPHTVCMAPAAAAAHSMINRTAQVGMRCSSLIRSARGHELRQDIKSIPELEDPHKRPARLSA